MKILKSLCMAFSMYSKIPMPRTDWKDENIKYAICCFPLVGLIIGASEVGIFLLCNAIGAGDIARAAVMTALPVLISGGIHVDGFIDTVDALSSYGDTKKKLEILKDPHSGAFAVIGSIMYFLLFFGFMSEIDSLNAVIVVAIGFVLSRSLSGLAICGFKSAKNSGLLHTFKNAAHKRVVRIVMWIYIILCICAMIITDLKIGCLVVTAAVLSLVWYRYIAYSKFGGTTGDIAGYFVCVCELLCVIGVGVLCVLL